MQEKNQQNFAAKNLSHQLPEKQQAKSCSPAPVGTKLQPAIFNYLRHHCQMRYSSQAQNTPLKSSNTSDTLQARPGEKL